MLSSMPTRARASLCLGLPLLLALACPSEASASELRFSTTVKGGVISTGNTLGLAKAVGENGPGTSDSIGTFLTLDDQLIDDFPANGNNPWPAGTTGDWMLNGSAAALQLPEVLAVESVGVEVLYAELVWGGSVAYGTEDVSGVLDTPVTLSVPELGDELEVVPDPQTPVTLNEVAGGGFSIRYYMRSAEVTDFVAEHGNALYAVSGVPATQDFGINQLNAGGWTLVVAYRSVDAPTRNLTVFVGGDFVDEGATEDYPVSGFCTPPQGTVEGSAVISAIEGDANRDGDVFQIAESGNGPFAPLFGPNNPVDNFFCSQLNGPDGEIEFDASSGDANHNALGAINTSGGRQGWDVTQVALSSNDGQLSAGQTSAVLRAVTTGDSFMPVLAAFEIDVSSPDFENGSLASISPALVGLGEQATAEFVLQNSGEVDATGVVFRSPLDPGLGLVALVVEGVDQGVDAGQLASGVGIGTIAAGASVTVRVTVSADMAPANGVDWRVDGIWAYDFVSCVGEPALTEESALQVVLDFSGEGGEEGSATDTDSGTATDTDTDSASGTDSDSDGTTDSDSGTDSGATDSDTDSDSLGGETGLTGFGADRGLDEDGCTCASGGRGGEPLAGFGLLALLAWLRPRREGA